MFAADYDFSCVEFPVRPEKLHNFERKNNVGITVIGYSAKERLAYPVKVADRKYECVVYILLTEQNVDPSADFTGCSSELAHYIAIINFSKFKGAANKHASFYCDYCLNRFCKQSRRDEHMRDCAGLGMQRIKMPKRKQDGNPNF